jgi:hypothetical protein
LVIQQDIAELKFNPNLNAFDMKLAEPESAGGSLTDIKVIQYMISALQGDPLRDTFWLHAQATSKWTKTRANQLRPLESISRSSGMPIVLEKRDIRQIM